MAELSSSSNSVPTYLNAPIRLEDVLVTSELDSRPQRSARGGGKQSTAPVVPSHGSVAGRTDPDLN